MRKLTLIATVIVLLANATWVSKSQAQWQQSTMKDPRFTVEFGAKAYNRPGAELGLPLIFDGVTMETLFDSNQASELGSAGGAEVKFGFVTGGGREFELRTIIADWEQDYEIVGDNLRSPFFLTPVAEPTTVTYDYDSDFFSIELMTRRAISPGITFMYGPRIVSTKDQVTFAGSRLIDDGVGGTVNVTQTTTTEATNILLGLQAGFEFNVPVSQYVYLNSFIRTGGYMNPSEVNTQTFDNISFTQPPVQTQTKSTGSFLAEVGGRVYFDVIPQGMATYVGYEATWIDGLALAPDQIVTTGTGVNTANTPFFHAVTFGVNFTY